MGEPTNNDIIELLKASLANTEKIHKETQDNFKTIKEELVSLKTSINTDLEAVKKENIELKERLAQVETKLHSCERLQKKYNIIAYGLPEAEDELTDIQRFLELINQKLGVDCRFTDLRDIHRIGKKSENDSARPRPLVIELINYKLKLSILAKTKELKGTSISISKDLTHEDYRVQKVLYTHLKKARANNFEAYLRNNILVVNGDEFTYLDLVKDITENTGTPEKPKETVAQKKQTEGRGAPSEKLGPHEKNKNLSGPSGSGSKRKLKNGDIQQPIKRSTRSNTANFTNYFS